MNPLELLYPSDGAAPPASDAELMRAIQSKAADSRASSEQFFASQGARLLDMARRLAAVFHRGGRLLTMGNGGSACDAAHLAVEFCHPITVGRRALPAIHLGAELAMVTAVGNDVGFAEIFRRQLIAHGRAGDALLGVSTSGNSENLIKAFAWAHGHGLATLGLSGGDGGHMACSNDVDCCVVVPTASVHRIQECHVAAYHVLWDLVHTLLSGHGGAP